ncbi:EAL domain-containing protein [Bradyrhizobium sp.]|uniref:bifunctional diguanylate cyclase/phosphodiesterase n=1 Tax=Bradyrhizobium sp. TaxID=376 RepID=UPI00239195FB|nr:EAL domain-containing protein [Bradyrhizobium sp.]MDE1934979.1 EAL domain-containing protein [Bradyrhizobium sp.]
MTADGTGSFNLKAFLSSGPIRSLIFGGAFLIAAIAVGTAFMVGNFRERALKANQRELENTVQLITRHFDQQLEDFTIVLKDIAARLHASGISSEILGGQLSTLAWHEELRTKVGAYSDAAGISVFDAEGNLVNSSEVWPVPDVKIADRTYFKTLKSGGASTPIEIELVRGRVFSGGWAIIMAQRLTGPNGEFAGIVARSIAPATLEKYLASVVLRDGAAISIYRRDGILLARYPHFEHMIGTQIRDREIFQYLTSSSGRGTVRVTSPIDGQQRLASANSLRGFPIAVVASTTIDAALADWREQTRFLIVVAVLSAITIAILLSFFIRKLLAQHRIERQRLDTAINNMSQGLLLYDSSERLVVCNQRYIAMYGLSADVVKPGLSFRDLLLYRKKIGSFKGDVEVFISNVRRNVAIGKTTRNTFETGDGRLIQILNQPLKNGWLATHDDITERTRAEEQIRHLAHYDALTDLPNRTLFHERLRQELAEAKSASQLAVLYIDIDEFKSVNDSLGHMIGDELLKSVASRLGACVEGADFVARLGGDEFAIVKTRLKDPVEVAKLAARVLETIRAPYNCLGNQLTSDASIGVAMAPQHGTDLEQILKNADMAMYAAKSAGRRTWRFFEPSMDAHVRARRQLETDLRKAIAEEALEVYYQPCLNLQNGTITGCEALVRWRHPERGMISPAEFIPLAEETGLINEIGEWVLAKACNEAASWPVAINVAVNVSPVQFRSGTLALKIVAALAESGLSAQRLELEITEAVLIRDDETALEILHQLRAIGIRIALDDFGTGYSSLSYLKRFPFDKIKIDRCFVNDLAEATDSSIVQAVVNIAAARHMTTTAEGVETERQQDLLRRLGCTEMQGFLFSAPKPAEEVRRMLLAHSSRPASVA